MKQKQNVRAIKKIIKKNETERKKINQKCREKQ